MQKQHKFVSFLPGFGMLSLCTMDVQGKPLRLDPTRNSAPDRDMLKLKIAEKHEPGVVL